MDPATGALTRQGTVPVEGGPSPLATDPARRFLYAGLRATNQIATYRIVPETGGLSFLGTVSLDADPCYLETDRTGRYLFASYYRAGKVTVHRIGGDGTVGAEPVQTVPTAEHAHCVLVDRTNGYVFVPHTVEPNRIFQFVLDADTGTLRPNAVPALVREAGVGPRHLCIHPVLDVVYSSNEQGCSATAYAFDSTIGTLTPIQTVSTLPEGYEGKNTCAQIHIHPTGRYLYVTNRGHDSVAVFAVDEATGRLSALGQQPTEPTPRVFNLDPTGSYLYAAGQGSGRMAAYRVDAQSGGLEPLATYAVGENPMWVLPIGLTGVP
jgi:6-phosphogluconolactonase